MFYYRKMTHFYFCYPGGHCAILFFFKGGLGRKFIEALAFLPLLISSPLPTRVIELKEGNKTEDFFP